MTSNVGLTTPRGSGTSGYIQRNLSVLKPRDTGYGAPYPPRNPHNTTSSSSPPRQRQPDPEILRHDREREIEMQIFALRDALEEAGEVGEEEVERRCEELRGRLRGKMEEEGGDRGVGKGKKALKPHQVHGLAEAKIRESERLRRALGIAEGRVGRAWEREGEGERGVKKEGREEESGREVQREGGGREVRDERGGERGADRRNDRRRDTGR